MSADRPLRGFPLPPERIQVSDVAGLVAQTLNAAQGSGRVWIYAGSARPEVYSDPRVTQAFYDLHAREVEFQVITAPIVLTDNEGQNGLLRMQKEGVIPVIRHQEKFYAAPHQIMVETGPPKPYDYFEEGPESSVTNRERYTAADWHNKASKLINSFSRLWGNLGRGQAITSPWLATPDLFRTLQNQAEETDQVFKYLDYQELLGLPSGRELRQYNP